MGSLVLVTGAMSQNSYSNLPLFEDGCWCTFLDGLTASHLMVYSKRRNGTAHQADDMLYCTSMYKRAG